MPNGTVGSDPKIHANPTKNLTRTHQDMEITQGAPQTLYDTTDPLYTQFHQDSRGFTMLNELGTPQRNTGSTKGAPEST